MTTKRQNRQRQTTPWERNSHAGEPSQSFRSLPRRDDDCGLLVVYKGCLWWFALQLHISSASYLRTLGTMCKRFNEVHSFLAKKINARFRRRRHEPPVMGTWLFSRDEYRMLRDCNCMGKDSLDATFACAWWWFGGRCIVYIGWVMQGKDAILQR